MIAFIFFACLTTLVHSGLITHDLGGDDIHGKATSYQTIHMEHFHAVPTFVKKEYKHLLEHPLPAGKSSSKVEIHHGGKHDHGYAIVDAENSAHGSGYDHHDHGNSLGHESAISGHEGAGFGAQGGGNLGGHEASGHLAAQALALSQGGYQVHDQNQELLQQHVTQGHEGLQLQAAAALAAHGSHGGASLGHSEAGISHGGAGLGQLHAAAGVHHGFEAAVANAALQFQRGGFDGHEHSS